MFEENNKSAETIDYFIKFDEKRFEKVKYMYINNLVETIRILLYNKYAELKIKYFYFYDLTEYEKIRKRFFKSINEEDLIKKIRKHPSIQKKKK